MFFGIFGKYQGTFINLSENTKRVLSLFSKKSGGVQEKLPTTSLPSSIHETDNKSSCRESASLVQSHTDFMLIRVSRIFSASYQPKKKTKKRAVKTPLSGLPSQQSRSHLRENRKHHCLSRQCSRLSYCFRKYRLSSLSSLFYAFHRQIKSLSLITLTTSYNLNFSIR